MPRPLFILGPFNFASGYYNLAAQVSLALLRNGKIDIRIDGRCNIIQEDAVRAGLRNIQADSGLHDWKMMIYPLSQIHERGAEVDAVTGESSYAKIIEKRREIQKFPPQWQVCPECHGQSAKVILPLCPACIDRSMIEGRSIVEVLWQCAICRSIPICQSCANSGVILLDSSLKLATPISINKKIILMTMWETNKLKPEWVESLNKSAAVIVPSQWCVDVFRKAGVTVPIYKVPLGVDTSVFTPRIPCPTLAPDYEREDDADLVCQICDTNGTVEAPFPDICTFGLAGTMSGGGFRKNLGQAVAAFRQAFPTEPDVRLRVKLSPACELPLPADDRIDVIKAHLTDAEMADWYRSLTVFVSPSLGEGFGLQPLESMACGRPVISTAYSGVLEYFDETVGYVVPHHMEAVPRDFSAVYEGTWAVPDMAELVNVLKWIKWGHKTPEQAEVAYPSLRYHSAQSAAKARELSWAKMGERLSFQLRKVLK